LQQKSLQKPVGVCVWVGGWVGLGVFGFDNLASTVLVKKNKRRNKYNQV
jgi:hypothetical protein